MLQCKQSDKVTEQTFCTYQDLEDIGLIFIEKSIFIFFKMMFSFFVSHNIGKYLESTTTRYGYNGT